MGYLEQEREKLQKVFECLNDVLGDSVSLSEIKAVLRLIEMYLKQKIEIEPIPIGTEKDLDNVRYIKISNSYPIGCEIYDFWFSGKDLNWKRKDYYVWEKLGNKPIKDDEILMHLNGNKNDCTLENMRAVKKGDYMSCCFRRYTENTPTLANTYISVRELDRELEKAKNKAVNHV